jgi:hypothetical protein
VAIIDDDAGFQFTTGQSREGTMKWSWVNKQRDQGWINTEVGLETARTTMHRQAD